MTRAEMERLWEQAQDPPADEVGIVIARFGRAVERHTARRFLNMIEHTLVDYVMQVVDVGWGAAKWRELETAKKEYTDA